jgi:hypothetical protein
MTIKINNDIMENIPYIYNDYKITNMDLVYKKISLYRDKVSNLDYEIKTIADGKFRLITKLFDSVKANNPSIFKDHLSRIQKDEKVSILMQMLNKIHVIENQILIFLDSKIN